MALDFKQMFQALAQIPFYSTWLLHADLSSTYRYERRVLKLLRWGYPFKPWRLKAPTQIMYLRYLDRTQCSIGMQPPLSFVMGAPMQDFTTSTFVQ